MASLRQRKVRDNSKRRMEEDSSKCRTEESSSTTSTSSHKQQHLKHHSSLVRQINRADDDDCDDEEEREFKRMIAQQQMRSSQETVKSMMRILIFLSGTFILLLLYFLVMGNPDDENASSLTKALRILLGMGNRRRGARLPKSARIVSSTSVSKKDLEQFVYPTWSWPWTSANQVQYLVSESAEDEPIREILHRQLSIKAKIGIDVELFDRDDMYLFLSGVHGQQCEAAMNDSDDTSSHDHAVKNLPILDQYQVFGEVAHQDGQKALWMWCMIYSKQAYGFVDLERHGFQLNRNLIYDLSIGKVKNLFIDVREEATNDNTLEMINLNRSSILFFPEQRASNVAKGMLQHLTRQIDSSKKSFQLNQESEEKMIALIESESELWTPLYISCEHKKVKRSVIDVCIDSDICCSIILDPTI